MTLYAVGACGELSTPGTGDLCCEADSLLHSVPETMQNVATLDEQMFGFKTVGSHLPHLDTPMLCHLTPMFNTYVGERKPVLNIQGFQ